MTANEWDDTKVQVEPYTGTVFTATIYLQSNYLFDPTDILFPSSERVKKIQTENESLAEGDVLRMLPIVSTFREGNISQHGVDKYFGDLRFITNIKSKVSITGCFIIAICIFVLTGLKAKQYLDKGKSPRQNKEKGSLL